MSFCMLVTGHRLSYQNDQLPVAIDTRAYDVNIMYYFKLMDELDEVLSDTGNEELTPEKDTQYRSVSCSLYALFKVIDNLSKLDTF